MDLTKEEHALVLEALRALMNCDQSDGIAIGLKGRTLPVKMIRRIQATQALITKLGKE